MKWALVGDKDSGGNTIVEGSPNNKESGRPIARVGDKLSDGSVITTGHPFVKMDGVPVAITGSEVSNGNKLVPTDSISQLSMNPSSFSSVSSIKEGLAAAGLLNKINPNSLTPEVVESLFEPNEIFNEHFVIIDQKTGEPLTEINYGLKTPKGVIESETGSDGKTDLYESNQPEAIEVEYLVQTKPVI